MILLKIGGGETINIDAIAQDIATLISRGEKVIIVHGASAKRDKIARQLGCETKTITSPSGITSVYTDKNALDIFLMAYYGLVNKTVVATMQKHGVNAVGLSGIDGRLWEARRKDVVYAVENGKTKLIRDNLTGKVEKINTDFMHLLLNNNFIPVICPPAISSDNQMVNTDNDMAAAVMVSAFTISQMIVLFEAPGMLRDVHNETSLITHIKKEELKNYMRYGQGRMKKKLLGAQKAFENGLKKMYWGDGRREHPVLNALKGKGTVIE